MGRDPPWGCCGGFVDGWFVTCYGRYFLFFFLFFFFFFDSSFSVKFTHSLFSRVLVKKTRELLPSSPRKKKRRKRKRKREQRGRRRACQIFCKNTKKKIWGRKKTYFYLFFDSFFSSNFFLRYLSSSLSSFS